jgi:hypothetical protein
MIEKNKRSVKSLCFYMQPRCGNQEPRKLIHEVIAAFSRKTEHLAFLRSFWEIRTFSVFVGKETSIPSRCTFIRSSREETTNCADSYNSSTSDFRDTQESYLVGLRCFRDIRKFALSIENNRRRARSKIIYMQSGVGQTTPPCDFGLSFSQQAQRHEFEQFLILEGRRGEFCDTKKTDKES